MGVTGYENLTDDEIVMKLERLKTTKYNLEREQRHRKEKEREERYKDVIGKIFLNKKDHIIARVTGIREPDVIGLTEEDVTKYKFICDTISFDDDSGVFKMQAVFHRGLKVHRSVTIEEFDATFWDVIDEDRAKSILDAWKQHINSITL